MLPMVEIVPVVVQGIVWRCADKDKEKILAA